MLGFGCDWVSSKAGFWLICQWRLGFWLGFANEDWTFGLGLPMKIGFQGCQWRLSLRNAKENWACWIGANENWTLRGSDFTFVGRYRDHKYDARCMNDILWLMHCLMLKWCKMQDTWWMFIYAMMDTMWCIVWCIHARCTNDMLWCSLMDAVWCIVWW
jgi:hypothetical protein